MENRKRIAPAQIIFAVPAALFLVTPLLDVFINFFQTITAKREWETFKIIPYLPVGILGILFLSLIFTGLFALALRQFVRKREAKRREQEQKDENTEP